VRAQLAGVGLNLLDEDLSGRMDASLTLQAVAAGSTASWRRA